MKTAKEIQAFILEKTGLKTSVKKGTGSMKGYLKIWPQFQNGEYPNIPFELARELLEILKEYDHEPHPVFCTISEIEVYGLEDERMSFKRERKPKPREEQKVREWGSKNSQMRLDKKAARYAKNLRNGTTGVRYN